ETHEGQCNPASRQSCYELRCAISIRRVKRSAKRHIMYIGRHRPLPMPHIGGCTILAMKIAFFEPLSPPADTMPPQIIPEHELLVAPSAETLPGGLQDAEAVGGSRWPV